MGIGHLMKSNPPDLIISGINKGANLAQDMYYSGTMAAAREAAFHNFPSIATSLVIEDLTKPLYFSDAAKVIARLIDEKIHESIPMRHLLNINVPNLPINEIQGVRATEVGFKKYSEDVYHRVDARGRDYYWLAGHYLGHEDIAGSDCNATSDGYVSCNIQELFPWNRKPSEFFIDKCDKIKL